MNSTVRLACIALGSALGLSACMHGRSGSMPMGGMGSGGQGQMCQMHRDMTAGKSTAEQRAAVEAHIRGMHGNASDQMVAHHMKMMEMHCGATPAR